MSVLASDLTLPIPNRCGSGPLCGCGKPSTLTDGTDIYPGLPHLAQKAMWKCPCGSSYVGCHPGTIKPLGTPADKETRRAREAAHAAFDPIWRDKSLRRTEAYRRLAAKLGISVDECHIGLFDIATCLKVQSLVMSGDLRKKAD